MKELISPGAIRNIALVGISKNAGKTTVLNYILRALPNVSWGIFSTGIDGETEDSVFKTPKPQLTLNPATIFCCDATWLNIHRSAVRVLSSVQYAGRKLFVARSETALETQITGPSAVSHQRQLISLMHRLGAEKVLVDGSLDRKSIALEEAIDMLILSIGASFGSAMQINLELRRILSLKDIPQASLSSYERKRLQGSESILIKKNGFWRETGFISLIKHEQEISGLLEQAPNAIYIPGSLTELVYVKLSRAFSRANTEIIVRHPECLKLELKQLQQLCTQNELKCLIPLRIKAFALNSTAIGKDPVGAEIFRQELRTAFPQLSFFDCMEI